MDDDQQVPFSVRQQVCDINFEIKSFLAKFESFRKTNVVDNVLCQNLSKLIEEIESYMDSEPKQIPSPELSSYDVNLEVNHLERILICNFCQIEIKDHVHSIRKHLESDKHNSRIEAVGENHLVKGRPIEKKREKKKDKSLKIPVRKNIPKKMGNFVRSDYFSFLSKSATTAIALSQIPDYDLIRKSLIEKLSVAYPKVRVYFFGSRISGLGNPDSDLDLYIDVGDLYNKQLDAQTVRKHVKSVKTILEKHADEWKMFTAILEARTPILRAYNHKYRIDCDMSFCSLGECNSLLIKYLIELQPIARLMCLFVKKWFNTTSYCDCFSSYVMTLLVIFHLQQQKFLPAIFVLQKCVEPTLVGPWQGNFARLPLSNFKMELIQVTPENLTKQLHSFFTFCCTVNYAKYIICPFTGTLIERAKFNQMKEIFTRYDNCCSKLPKKEQLLIEKPVCVQDPLEHNHNVAKGMSAKVLITFLQDCSLTANELKAQLKSK